MKSDSVSEKQDVALHGRLYLKSTLKRLFDVCFALAMLIMLSPLLILAIALVALDGGPVFYSQRRVGQGGQVFNCWKFRTMMVNAEAHLKHLIETDEKIAAEWNATQKLKKDPRITWVGRWLRRTSVDELPQFFNVLNGTMSVVGPRPFAEDQLDLYSDKALVKYLAAKPGLTGSWQVHARHDTTFECRAKYDALYVEQASFGLDLALVFKTPLAMLRGS